MTENQIEPESRGSFEPLPVTLVDAPGEYPPPTEGEARMWVLRTPYGERVGTLLFNDGGLEWSADPFDLMVTEETQDYALEVQAFFRTMFANDVPVDVAIEEIRVAYAGDIEETVGEYVPSTTPEEEN